MWYSSHLNTKISKINTFFSRGNLPKLLPFSLPHFRCLVSILFLSKQFVLPHWHRCIWCHIYQHHSNITQCYFPYYWSFEFSRSNIHHVSIAVVNNIYYSLIFVARIHGTRTKSFGIGTYFVQGSKLRNMLVGLNEGSHI